MTEYKNNPFPVSTPEEQGIPSAAVIHFFEQVEARDIELHSLQVVRNGSLCINTVAAPYTWDSFHRIFSAAKGVVATAILFAIQDGYFEIDSLVVPLLPERYLPEDLDERWQRLTVYHLLTMTSGHDCDTLFKMWGKSDCWIRTFFETRPAYEPGTYFCYDMGAQYVMNELIALHTGRDTGKYLKEKLFDKLGIQYTNNYTEPEGLFFSSSIQFTPDALTKLSQFYLQKGMWEGEQLLREDLAEAAGAHHGPSFHYDPTGLTGQVGRWEGYALHMWRLYGGFAFRGGQGQVGLILPDEKMAVGITCADSNYDELIEIFYRTVIGESFNHPIKVNAGDAAKAAWLQNTFNLAPRNVTDSSSEAARVSGVTYLLEENPVGQQELTFIFEENQVKIHSVSDREEKTVICGLRGQWPEGDQGYILTTADPEHVADLDRIFGYDTHRTMYSGGWSRQNTFAFRLRSASLLCDYRFECEFIGEEIFLKLSYNTVMSRNKYKDRTKAPAVWIHGRKKDEDGGKCV
ncbi:MAG: beta-lactamase family protein [Lachnospiraceae bacterium]|nr:beta-lactamase family protein [Lachnospiraceae bacterium]